MAKTTNQDMLRQAASQALITTGGSRNTASSSSASAARKTATQQAIQNNPSLTMTQQQKNIVQGMIRQHPEIVTNAYGGLVDNFTKAYNIMSGGVTNRLQLQSAGDALANLRSGITTLQGLRTAMGLDTPDEISQVLSAVSNGYNGMVKDYLDADARINPVMAPSQGRAGGIASPGMMTDGVTTALGAARGLDISPRHQSEQPQGGALNWLGQVGTAAGKNVMGADVGSAAAIAEAVGSSYARGSARDTEREVYASQQAQVMQERQMYIDESVKRGYEPDANILAMYDRQIEALDPKQVDEGIRRGRETRTGLYDTSERLMNEGEEARQRAAGIANSGGLLSQNVNILGMKDKTIGDLLTDTAVAGAEMLSDAAVGAITGVGTMAPMLIRSFGGAASEAAQNGADVDEQLFQGVKSAAIEWATEKLFAGNPIYDEGGGVITDAVYKLLYNRFGEEAVEKALSSAAAKIAKVPLEMAAEGIEEILSDYLNPWVNEIANSFDGGNRDMALPDAETVGSDFLIGAMLGGMGQVTEAVSNTARTAMQARGNNAAQESDFLTPEETASEPVTPKVDTEILERERAAMLQEAQSESDESFIVDFSERYRKTTNAMHQALVNHNYPAAEAYQTILNDLDAAQKTAEGMDAAPDITAAVRNYILDNYGGTNNGTEGSAVLDADGGRNAGESAGVEGGAVQPVGEGVDRGGAEGGRWDRVVSAADTSAAELGVQHGTENIRNRIIPEADWTENERAAAERAGRLGLNVTYVTGGLEITNPTTGETQTMVAHVNGDRVVVRADSNFYSAEKVTDHEITHARIAADPALLDDMLARTDLTDQEIDRIAAQYARAYNFVYGAITEDMTADEVRDLCRMYLEEFVCDAAAGLDRVGVRGAVTPSRYTDTANEVIRERESMGYGAGGMPGSRYANDQTEGENNTGSEDLTDRGEGKYNIAPEDPKLARAIEMTKNGAFPSEIYNETGYARLMNGDIQDPNTGEILWRLRDGGTGDSDRGTVVGEAQGHAETGVTGDDGRGLRGSIRSDLGRDTKAQSRQGWKELTDFQQQRAVKIINDHANRAGGSEELTAIRREWGGERAFAEYIYDLYSRGNGVLETMTNYLGNTADIADALDMEFEQKEPSDSAKTGVTVQDGVTSGPDSSSDKRITETAEESNTEFTGLRSNIPGLTRWDREAEAREAARKEQKARYSAEEAGEIGEAAYDEEQEARLAANIEAMTPTELRRAVNEDRSQIQSLEGFLKRELPENLKRQLNRELSETRSRLEREQARLREVNVKIQEERKAARKQAEARQIPRKSREDFIKDTLDHFSITEGRQEIGGILGGFFDDARRQGVVDDRMKETLFRRLVDAGLVSAAADPAYQNIRTYLAHTRIYVPADVRGDFGDNYQLLRNRAMGSGIILTSDPTDNQIDVLNGELAERYPGTFRATDTDRGAILEKIIDAAEQGKDEKVTLMEMLQRVENFEGWSVDSQLDNMMDWLDNRVDKALYAAGIEVKQKAKNAMQLAQERAERRAALERQAEQRSLRELQHKTMSALQWLKKNRRRAPEELKARYDEVLSDINLYTLSAANEMRWSDKHQATYGDLVNMYKDAQENDPNWIPSKELERLMSMVDGRAIADMDIDELDTLYKAAVALRTEFYNRNNVINDEQHRLFSEVFRDSTEEIRGSGGQGTLGKGLGKLTNAEMMTPMNLLNMIGGWRKDGQWYGMAKQLQSGERDRKGYSVRAQAMLEEFNETYKDWVRTADGQGKDAVWYEIEVPELMEQHMGDKPIFGESKTVYMTPMQKVQLYLESKNDQNLQHMTGGRTFVNRELYSKGKRSEAMDQGTTIRLAKETVKSIVSDMTEEEMELAGLMERYYNGMAKEEINKVSNVLYGYDKAMIDYYAPIFTDSNYNKSTAGLFDVTAEGVGHMKSREQVSKNPSYNLSAIDAFQRHIDQTSRFVGLAIPIRNMQTLVNWYGDGTTMKKVLSDAWGGESVSYIEKLMTDLQSPQFEEKSVLEQLGDKAVSNYISAVFGANPGIVFKQAASYPAAAAVLGFENVPSPGQLRGIDEELIGKYTPELAYRKLGYGTPEIAKMRDNPNILDRNKATRFLLRGGAIQWMDVATVKNLWPWAENYVRKNFPELEVGDQTAVDAGTSPYYKKVAEIFNEAVNVTQPMYDTMNRARIMDSKSALVRTLTLFKTVPMQEYNTLRKYMGEARDGSRESKKAAARSVASILASTVMLEAIAAGAAWVKNGLKYYRDDEDELTAESFAREFGLDIAGDLAGIMIGGSEIFEAITHHLGLSGYSSDFNIVGTEQINEIRDALSDAADLLEKTIGGALNVRAGGGDVGAYLKRNRGDLLGGIHDLATTIAKYADGFPAENIEKYLGGILSKAAPELAAAIAGAFDTTTKKDLSYIPAEELPTRLADLLNIRSIEAGERTGAELARLYLDGRKTVIPADTPTKIGEKELTAYEMQVYDNAYSAAIGKSLDALVESDAYIEADDDGRADMLKMLFDYAGQNAFRDIEPDYTFSSTYAWIEKANEATENGIDVTTYISARQTMKEIDAANDGNGSITQAEATDALRYMDLTNDQRAILWQLTNKSWKEDRNPFIDGNTGYVDTGGLRSLDELLGYESTAGGRLVQVIPVEEWSESERNLERLASDRGISIHYVEGGIYDNSSIGGLIKCLGLTNSDGDVIVVSRISGDQETQVIGHELTHAICSENQNLRQECIDYLVGAFGEDEMQEMAQIFAKEWRYCYGNLTGETQDEIGELTMQYLEELICDAASGFCRYLPEGLSIEKYVSPIREIIFEQTGVDFESVFDSKTGEGAPTKPSKTSEPERDKTPYAGLNFQLPMVPERDETPYAGLNFQLPTVGLPGY